MYRQGAFPSRPAFPSVSTRYLHEMKTPISYEPSATQNSPTQQHIIVLFFQTLQSNSREASRKCRRVHKVLSVLLHTGRVVAGCIKKYVPIVLQQETIPPKYLSGGYPREICCRSLIGYGAEAKTSSRPTAVKNSGNSNSLSLLWP